MVGSISRGLNTASFVKIFPFEPKYVCSARRIPTANEMAPLRINMRLNVNSDSRWVCKKAEIRITRSWKYVFWLGLSFEISQLFSDDIGSPPLTEISPRPRSTAFRFLDNAFKMLEGFVFLEALRLAFALRIAILWLVSNWTSPTLSKDPCRNTVGERRKAR